MAAYSQRLDQRSVEVGVARRNFDHQLEQIRSAEQCGVLLALGTDAGSLGVNHGTAVREEMKIWMSAGLSLEKTIQCASSRGATLLGLEEEMGTLAPGKPATFLAVRGDPEGLPDALNSPGRIYMRGKEVSA